jgi:hypothetical protein
VPRRKLRQSERLVLGGVPRLKRFLADRLQGNSDRKSKFFKRYANRRLRKLPLEESYPHKTYKKTFCSYDICDYESVGTTFEEYWRQKVKWWYAWRYRYEPYPTKAQAYKEYYKYFLKK